MEDRTTSSSIVNFSNLTATYPIPPKPALVGQPVNSLRWRRPLSLWAKEVFTKLLREIVNCGATEQPMSPNAQVILWWLAEHGIMHAWSSGDLFLRSLRTSRAGTGTEYLSLAEMRTAHTQRFALTMALTEEIRDRPDWQQIADVLADDSERRRSTTKDDLFAICHRAVVPQKCYVMPRDRPFRRAVHVGYECYEYDCWACAAIKASGLPVSALDVLLAPELHARFAKEGWMSKQSNKWDNRPPNRYF